MSALPSSDMIGFSGALIAILNPLAAVPTFVSLTTTHPELNRQQMAVTAAITVAIVLAGACLFGVGVLTTFGTDLNAFRVGGGLIVVLTGIRMATDARPANAGERSTIDGISVGAVPMALPLICGPTAISTVILQASGATGRAPVLAAIAVATVTIWLTLTLSQSLFRWLGTVGVSVATRLFGLLLSSIGASLVLSGAKQALNL
jgi:multiple antibiotic resistance protein